MIIPVEVETALIEFGVGVPLTQIRGALRLAEHGLIHYTTDGWRLTKQGRQHLANINKENTHDQ